MIPSQLQHSELGRKQPPRLLSKRFPADLKRGPIEERSQRLKWTHGSRVMIIFGRSVARSLGRSVARSLGRSVARSLGRSVARSIGRSVARSVARSIGRSVARSLDRSIARSLVWSGLFFLFFLVWVVGSGPGLFFSCLVRSGFNSLSSPGLKIWSRF